MARLAPLRRNLDFLPSPLPDRPGLLLRDPWQFAQGFVVIPAALLPLLAYFDGEHTREDLLARITGADEAQAAALVDHVERTLSDGGFLEDGTYARHRADRIRAFRDAPVRAAAHAGGAYPGTCDELGRALAGWTVPPVRASRADVIAIAAPHVSPEGGWPSYAAAYDALPSEGPAPTVVVLGTSHYGEPDAFAVTRKPFATPCGDVAVDVDLVERLASEGGSAVLMDDYSQAVEHSVEFQAVFLRHRFGPGVRIVPVLCGAFRQALESGYPEDDPRVARVLEALGAVAADRPDVRFVLGVDMAHIGRRYGDPEGVRANEGPMTDVAARDRDRIARLEQGDARGFWDLVRGDGGDALRWCGSSPFYTFARSVPDARAELLRYEQWNIDDQSVVTFAGLVFRRPAARENPR